MHRPKELKIVCVCSSILEPFIRVLGIDEVYHIDRIEDVKTVMERLLMRNDVGIILVEWSLYKYIEELDTELLLRKQLYPIIIPIPNPDDISRVDVREYYREFVKKYVGFELYV